MSESRSSAEARRSVTGPRRESSTTGSERFSSIPPACHAPLRGPAARTRDLHPTKQASAIQDDPSFAGGKCIRRLSRVDRAESPCH